VPPLLLVVVVVLCVVLVVEVELLVVGFAVVVVGAAAAPPLVLSLELDPQPTATAAMSANAATPATARYQDTDHLWRSISSSCWSGIDSLERVVAMEYRDRPVSVQSQWKRSNRATWTSRR
jgi:hypothetical protein